MIARFFAFLGAFALSGALSGCGGTPEPTAEEKDPNFGKSAMDQMKNMGVTPGSKQAKSGTP